MTTVLNKPGKMGSSDDASYEADFYSWTQHQSALLRSGKLDLTDVEHLAEEIETLGRSEAAALRSSYRLICRHFLKMKHQAGQAATSRQGTINRERLNDEAPWPTIQA